MDSATWDERYAADDLVWSAGPNRFVVEQVDGLAPGRALDLAGGEGRNAIWLAQQGWDVELVEFSQVALDKAARRAEHAGVDVTLTSADLTASPTLRPADLVLLAYLQLPRESSTRTTRLAASAVAPGGTLLIVAHARRNLDDGVGGPPDPAVLRTVEETLADLEGTGLGVKLAGEVTRTVETDEGPRDAIDLLIRAERGG
ncbi:MAG: class I SAM-dependent methyltransferase [Nitriliruptor sp.]|nr:MAG: class I SAM-dependent methyltransferase [Nitriliruptor sp.]